ncbi:hypothetical protein J6590_085164 [Homalodisca vitripennis]|nr:hypothetical protein J6590_085164 [Homalodisca vitripennis]
MISFPKKSYDSSTKQRAWIKQLEAIGGVWTLAPGALPRRFEAFARERVEALLSSKEFTLS